MQYQELFVLLPNKVRLGLFEASQLNFLGKKQAVGIKVF